MKNELWLIRLRNFYKECNFKLCFYWIFLILKIKRRYWFYLSLKYFFFKYSFMNWILECRYCTFKFWTLAFFYKFLSFFLPLVHKFLKNFYVRKIIKKNIWNNWTFEKRIFWNLFLFHVNLFYFECDHFLLSISMLSTRKKKILSNIL